MLILYFFVTGIKMKLLTPHSVLSGDEACNKLPPTDGVNIPIEELDGDSSAGMSSSSDKSKSKLVLGVDVLDGGVFFLEFLAPTFLLIGFSSSDSLDSSEEDEELEESDDESSVSDSSLGFDFSPPVCRFGLEALKKITR